MVPLHPKIIHLPIALSVLMPLISAGLLLAWVRGWLPRRAFLIALLLQAVLVGSAYAGIRSGEADEERVEAVMSEAPIEEHEEASKAFTVAAAVVLVIMAAAFLPNERAARSGAALSFLGTLVVLGLGYRAGAAGGRLVYVHGATDAFRSDQPAGATAAGSPDGRGREEDEED